jgi:hypothetical protein
MGALGPDEWHIQESIEMLASLCLVEVRVKGQVPFNQIR